MNKYCFELYETSERGQIFLGFKTVKAESNDHARKVVSEKLPENVRAIQIYIPQ